MIVYKGLQIKRDSIMHIEIKLVFRINPFFPFRGKLGGRRKKHYPHIRHKVAMDCV
jgi:hypothetical protein